MPRFYAHFILLSLLIFAATLFLLCAQPYDDHGLRQFLLPDDCAAPCFMGIRPGITIVEEAIPILLASNWVTYQPSNFQTTSDIYSVNFQWNGNQPDFIDASEPLQLIVLSTDPKKIIQITIWLHDTFSLGNYYLALGRPSRIQAGMSPPNSAPTPYLNILQYFDTNDLTLLWATECPIRMSQILEQHYGARIDYNFEFGPDISLTTFKDILEYPTCG